MFSQNLTNKNSIHCFLLLINLDVPMRGRGFPIPAGSNAPRSAAAAISAAGASAASGTASVPPAATAATSVASTVAASGAAIGPLPIPAPAVARGGFLTARGGRIAMATRASAMHVDEFERVKASHVVAPVGEAAQQTAPHLFPVPSNSTAFESNEHSDSSSTPASEAISSGSQRPPAPNSTASNAGASQVDINQMIFSSD